jgi:hypothetical protein
MHHTLVVLRSSFKTGRKREAGSAVRIPAPYIKHELPAKAAALTEWY